MPSTQEIREAWKRDVPVEWVYHWLHEAGNTSIAFLFAQTIERGHPTPEDIARLSEKQQS